MKTGKLLALIGIAILALYSGWFLIMSKLSGADHSPSMTTREFALGTWRKEAQGSDERGNYTAVYQIEFMRSGTLVYDEWRVYSDHSRAIGFYNLKMHYQFLDYTQVKITGRIIENWNLFRDGENLQIDSGRTATFPAGEYGRLDVLEWSIFALGLGVLTVGIIYLQPRTLMAAKFQEIRTCWANIKWSLKFVLDLVFHGLIILAILSAGLIVGIYLAEDWTFFFIRLPWDAVLLFEIGLIFLIVGIRTGLSLVTGNLPSSSSVQKWIAYPGVFLAGMGLWGVLVGLFYFSLFLFLDGTYGSGA